MGKHFTEKTAGVINANDLYKMRGPGNASVQKPLFQNTQTTVKNTACDHYLIFTSAKLLSW